MIFRSIVPWGTVLAPSVNLGIALNYERAENYVFETLRSPQALILEDDLVLSSQYLQVIRWLIGFAQQDSRIAKSCHTSIKAVKQARVRLGMQSQLFDLLSPQRQALLISQLRQRHSDVPAAREAAVRIQPLSDRDKGQ